ncbi:MAG: N-acetyl-gamma-glutamyl-phosphate reductase [bacterium]|nr:N-acetyl-gamma-glutamyl-phosphate reductase [bacterium]
MSAANSSNPAPETQNRESSSGDAVPVAVIGAGGFTGHELLTLMRAHPRLYPVHITSNAYEGRRLSDVFPDLDGADNGLTFSRHDAPLPDGVPVFLAVPNDTSLALVPDLLQAGHPVVDLSGSFRLHDGRAFEERYKLKHTPASAAAMSQAVFGMPEILRDSIRGAQFVSNPGCFPTGAVIPLAFLGAARQDLQSVVVDAKSGVSGAGGRTEDGGFVFHKVHENFRAYKILGHQHQPEIEEYAALGMPGTTGAIAMPSAEAPPTLPVVFTPHLLPLFRGILSTIVLIWKSTPPADLAERLRHRCESEPFIRFRDTPEAVELASVQNTNYLDLGLRTSGNTTVIVTAIDNLIKGAAGQAIQNLNLMLDFPETAGLL